MRKSIGLVNGREIYLNNGIEFLIGRVGTGKTYRANEYIMENYEIGAVIIGEEPNITENFLRQSLIFSVEDNDVEESLRSCLQCLDKLNVYIPYDEIRDHLEVLDKVFKELKDNIKFVLLDGIIKNLSEIANIIKCDMCITGIFDNITKGFPKNYVITTWDYRENANFSGNISLRIPKSLHNI